MATRRRSSHSPGGEKTNPWDFYWKERNIYQENRYRAASAADRSITYNAQEAYEQIIYGKNGNIAPYAVLWEGVNSGRLLVRYLIGFGPIQSITNIRVGGVLLSTKITELPQNWTPSNVTGGYQVYLGTADQPVCGLLSQFRTNWIPSTFPGRAYVTILFPQTPEGEAPLDFTNMLCDVEGLLIRDPTTDATLVNRYYRENPALFIADLLTSKRYGYRLEDDKVNWTKIVNDVTPYVMENLGGGIIRYPVGLMFQRQSTIKHMIEEICNHAQLWITTNEGVYNINVDKPRSAVSFSITDEDLEEGFMPSVYSKGDNEVVDSLNVNYIDESSGWIDKSTPIEDPAIHNSNEPITSEDLNVRGCHFLQQAKRIGYYRFNRKQLNLQFNLKLGPRGALLSPGDRVPVNCSLRNINQDLVVVDAQPDGLGWRATFEVYDEAIFSNSIQTEIGIVKPANPSPQDIPPAPTGLTLTEEIAGQDSRVKIAFTPAPVSHTGQYTRIMVRRTVGATTYPWYKLNDTTGSVDYIINTNPGETYEVSLKTFTSFDKESATALTGSITTTGVNLTGPQGPQGPQGNAGANAKTLTVISDRQTINYDSAGNPSPSAQTTTFSVNKQNTTGVVNWTATKADGTAITPVTNLLSAATGDSVTMSAANFNTQRGTTEGVIVTASITDGTTFSDKISVVRVSTGNGLATWVENGGAVYSPSSLGKKTGANNWDGGIYSTEGYLKDVSLSVQVAQLAVNWMAGLNDNPSASGGFNDIDYLWHCNGSNTLQIYENGSLIGSYGTAVVGDTLSITYDGYIVRYFKNGVLQRSIARTMGTRLYADFSFYEVLTTPHLKSVAFGPTGTQGENAVINLATPELWTVSAGDAIGKYPAYYNGNLISPNFLAQGNNNDRVVGVDPFGKPGILWRTFGNAAGFTGFHKSFPVDPNKSYLVHVYVCRTASVSSEIVYFGIAKDSAISKNMDGTGNADPYFGNISHTALALNEWYCLIGIIHGANTGLTTTPATSIAGVYRLRDGQKVTGTVFNDLKMGSTATMQTMRIYAPYSSTVGNNSYVWGPGVYEINGNEPKIEQLIRKLPPVLVAPSSLGAIGGRVIVASTTKLAVNLLAAATSIVVEQNIFSSGDRAVVQRLENGVQQTEYIAITSAASGTGPYTYTITRNLNGGGAIGVSVGEPIINLGQTGSHFIDIYTVTGLKSGTEVGPTIVGNQRLSSTYNDWSPRWAIGNLNGLYGYNTNIYGAAFGVPTGAWLKIDPVNGLRIGYNNNSLIEVDATGNAYFSGTIQVGGNFNVTGNFTVGVNKIVWDGTNLSVQAGNLLFNSTGYSFNSLNPKGMFENGPGLILRSSGTSGYIDIGTDIITLGDSLIDVFATGGISTTASAAGAGYFNATNGLKVNGVQVVGAQLADVADPLQTLASLQTAVIALRNRMRSHGLIQTSA
jgi:hypothetical protein